MRPSRWLVLAHGAVLLTLSLLPLLALISSRPTAIHWFALMAFEGLLVAEYWRFHRARTSPSPEAVTCEEDGSWSLSWGSRSVTAEAVGEQVVLPWLQVLRLREVASARRHRLIVLPDCASRDDRRRLRLWMRLGRG
ncbi:protein YgfX [Marinimicrobium agarilyticum]|uniref:protein YgfX n=1 Tax=Marinimicrobium agarilyticum TaxID=306546 RepID=UPI00048178E7